MTPAARTAYLNGKFLPLEQARVSPLDRAFLFGDAVYEVIPVYSGRPFLLNAHLDRLARSLDQLHISNPHTATEWVDLIGELITRNGDGDQAVYLQVTRGVDARRDHAFPEGIRPTVFAMSSPAEARRPDAGVKAITLPDNRWGRCDIKATALLANVLARQAACEAGAADAILIWNGEVTEGAGSSVIIVEHGSLIRRPNGREILAGTTMEYVIELARSAGLKCGQEPISENRLRNADEIWLTSAMRGIAPVTELDGRAVGDGRPGPVWRQVATLLVAKQHGQ